MLTLSEVGPGDAALHPTSHPTCAERLESKGSCRQQPGLMIHSVYSRIESRLALTPETGPIKTAIARRGTRGARSLRWTYAHATVGAWLGARRRRSNASQDAVPQWLGSLPAIHRRAAAHPSKFQRTNCKLPVASDNWLTEPVRGRCYSQDTTCICNVRVANYRI